MEIQYAGFWRRLGAALADAALLGVVGSILSIVLATAHFPSLGPLSSLIYNAFECVFVFPIDSIFSLIDICLFGLGLKGVNNDFPHSLWYLPGNLISYSAGCAPILPFLTVNWLYHAVMESSAKQATLGKLLFKIRITDSNGQRISFWKATARHFSKILSTSLLLIGFMMAGWTKKKQALHDQVAGCLLVRQIRAIGSASLSALLLMVCSVQFLAVPVSAAGPKLRVALFVDDGTSASEFRKEFRRSDSLLWKSIDGDDIRNGELKNFDALVVPGGGAKAEAESMGADAREAVRHFVNEGGVYLGVCAGAYLASQGRPFYLGFLPITTSDSKHWYRVDDMTPVSVELTPLGMEVFGIDTSNIRIGYENGPIFAPLADKLDESLTPLGFYRSEVVGDGGKRGVMLGAPSMILSKYGQGMVLAISPHPEATPGIKQAEVHALHWLYDHRSAKTPPQSTGAVRPSSSTLGDRAIKLAQEIFDQASAVNYTHKDVVAARQIVTEPDGTMTARTDCSGFISYIVHSIAPLHYRIVRLREPSANYPQAKIWAHFFDAIGSDRPYYGWLGIRNWRNLRSGDVLAWVEGASASSAYKNTGHVMLAVGKPSDIKEEKGFRYFEIPVIDSSSVYHFAPEKLPPNAHQEHRNGLGMGVVRIILSETDEPIGYWAGTYWGEGNEQVDKPTLSKVVRFARMVPNE